MEEDEKLTIEDLKPGETFIIKGHRTNIFEKNKSTNGASPIRALWRMLYVHSYAHLERVK